MTARPLRATPAPWAALAAALGNHWRYVADPADQAAPPALASPADRADREEAA